MKETTSYIGEYCIHRQTALPRFAFHILKQRVMG